VLTIQLLEHAVPLAQALVRADYGTGGHAAHCVRARGNPRHARRGARCDRRRGTLTRARDFSDCAAAGAQFGVTPGLTAELIAAAAKSGFPLLPGIMTPAELIAARARASRLQAVPAQQAACRHAQGAGGPFPDHVFCPTGGVSRANAAEYLALPNVLCVGGSWVTRRGHGTGDWTAIESLARDAASLGAERRACAMLLELD